MVLEIFSRPHIRSIQALIFTAPFSVSGSSFFQTPAAYLVSKGISLGLGQSISEPLKCAISLTISSVFFKLIRDVAASRGLPIARWNCSQACALSACVLISIILSNLPRTFLTVWYQSLEKEKADLDIQIKTCADSIKPSIERANNYGFSLSWINEAVGNYRRHILAPAINKTYAFKMKELSETELKTLQDRFEELDRNGCSFMNHFQEFATLHQKNENLTPDLEKYKPVVAENLMSAIFSL